MTRYHIINGGVVQCLATGTLADLATVAPASQVGVSKSCSLHSRKQFIPS